MTVEAYAKVNLTLEVYGRRADGYHELRSVVQPIGLSDTLEIEGTADGRIESDAGYGEVDLIVRAVKALRAATGDGTHGARVRVTKRIPVGGGLGGGSADAAATLRALNAEWGCGLTPARLAEIGAGVGSDVPALVLAQETRRPVLMEGRGERVLPLPAAAGASGWLVLANPGEGVSTAAVYARCTPRAGAPAGGSSPEPVNDLQAAACELCPAISAALAALAAAGATDVRMSGSGSTVFGQAPSESAARATALALETRGWRAWAVRTLSENELSQNEKGGKE